MIDAHLHLQDERLFPNAEAVLETCRHEGIQRLIVNGTRPDDWVRVAALAERFPEVRASYGLHPWYVKDVGDDWEALLEGYLQHEDAIGVGEIGLDKWIRGHDSGRQKDCFVRQLRVAVTLGLPVTIHCLKAWGHLRDALCTETLPEQGFLLHSFGGPAEMVDEFVALGGYFSLSGYFFHERKRDALEIFLQRVPRERLLLETDAPDMALPSDEIRFGQQEENHPANLVVIYERMARLLGCSPETLMKETRHNARRLFGDSL